MIANDIYISKIFTDKIYLTDKEKKVLSIINNFSNDKLIKVNNSIMEIVADKIGENVEQTRKIILGIKSKRKSYELNNRNFVMKQALKDTWERIYDK
jgi:hypothetical protein